MNYTLEEYASDIVYNIMDVCDDEKVPHPNIVSESGRAIVAHHSVLVVRGLRRDREDADRAARPSSASDHKLTARSSTSTEDLSDENLNESWHDLQQIKEQSQQMFELGLLAARRQGAHRDALLADRRAAAEHHRCTWIRTKSPRICATSNIELADQHICNFSVFQSLLDHWALGAALPDRPRSTGSTSARARESTLVDITCDSDGKVAKYIDRNDVRDTLPLHALRDGAPYYLGIFLTGAYQDIMGDIHNLFGRVNEVHVFLDDDEESGYYLEETIAGNTIGEVLAMTQYDDARPRDER